MAIEVNIVINAKVGNMHAVAFDHQTGNVVAKVSGGMVRQGNKRLSGKRKGSSHASTTAMKLLVDNLKDKRIKYVKNVVVTGLGPGRDLGVINVIQSAGFSVEKLKSKDCLPHGGVRRKKQQRK